MIPKKQSFEKIVDYVFYNAKKEPKKIILVDENDAITNYQLVKRITKKAQELKRAGVEKKDPIILISNQNADFIVWYLACHLIEATVVPIDNQIPKSKLKRTQSFIDPKALIENNYISRFNNNKTANFYPESSFSPAEIIFTSGTTGAPKGVVIDHDAQLNATKNIVNYIKNDKNDVELISMPLSHSFGLARMRSNLLVGSKIILQNGLGRLKQFFSNIKKYEVSGLGLVPTALRLILNQTGNYIAKFQEQIKYIELGSAEMSDVEKNDLQKLFPNTRVCMHYGLTEASRSTFLDFDKDKRFLKSIGKQSPNVKISIFDDEGKVLNKGTEGEICIKSKTLFSGYYKGLNNDKLFFGKFFRTGDTGKIDQHNYLHLLGRRKEIINVGGRNVSPVEIEKHLNNIEYICESVCIGLPDDISGEKIKALIVVNDQSIDFDTIKSYLKEKIELFKIPSSFSLIDFIPKTASGKIQRNKLKNQFLVKCKDASF